MRRPVPYFGTSKPWKRGGTFIRAMRAILLFHHWFLTTRPPPLNVNTNPRPAAGRRRQP